MSGFELTMVSREMKLRWPYELEAVTAIKIVRQPGEHARVSFSGIIPEEQMEKYMEAASHRDVIEVFKRVGERDERIFAGTVSNLTIRMTRDVYVAEVEGISSTYELDTKRRSRSFQDRSMSYADVIGQVLHHYPHADFIDMAGGDRSIRKFLLQYEETDWQFLQRLASHFGTVLVPDVTEAKPRLWFGMPQIDRHIEPGEGFYEVTKALKEYMTSTARQGQTNLTEEDFTAYEVVSDQLLPVGNTVTFRGKELVVVGSIIELHGGSVRMTYTIASPKGICQPYRVNPLLTGLSLEGRAIAVNRKMVKIHLDIDDDEPHTGTSWFPYAAEGNNAWYSMPKTGSRIQLYFPDSNENHAFVTSSVRGSGDSMKSHPKMSNPNVKSFVSNHGKAMELGEGNITFTSGMLSITMNDKDGIQFTSSKKISVKPGEELTIGWTDPSADPDAPPPPPPPKQVSLKATKSLTLMQGLMSGVGIDEIHKLLASKIRITGTVPQDYPMLSSEGQRQAVQAAEKLQAYKAYVHEVSEERKNKGIAGIAGGLFNAVCGAMICAVGVAAVGFGALTSWTGVGIAVAAAGAVAAASGAYMVASGIADIGEGIQDVNFANKGDTESKAFNFVRDTLFDGNEDNYRMSVDIAMITGGLFAEFVAPMAALAVVVGGVRFSNRMSSKSTPPGAGEKKLQRVGPGTNKQMEDAKAPNTGRTSGKLRRLWRRVKGLIN
ncbi:contractile injection system protein, VgrG/Pvc8 family [Paenibacillus tyrfis]|uniref:contractile injection system protein, VgrG/Pvc8 family n=1 Tax=Paenibacillus tyrfis TaxID=1501230 RepID=UPI0020A19655|nr:contractile injection system protein, VgrG/Pvc8 family [Paenibacillus tyrfis]MCP1308093.1 phage late control D family protein [Paenibacillus tyrfis]